MPVDDLVFSELEASGFVVVEEHGVGDVIKSICIFISLSTCLCL
jgi:hypothetical protein